MLDFNYRLHWALYWTSRFFYKKQVKLETWLLLKTTWYNIYYCRIHNNVINNYLNNPERCQFIIDQYCPNSIIIHTKNLIYNWRKQKRKKYCHLKIISLFRDIEVINKPLPNILIIEQNIAWTSTISSTRYYLHQISPTKRDKDNAKILKVIFGPYFMKMINYLKLGNFKNYIVERRIFSVG